MSGIGSGRTLKRKNVKGLALAAPAPRAVAPSDDQTNGGDNARQTAQLEIGIEYKLDLKREDLEVLKELGHGNGGTVSKVRHMATGTVMARKVGHRSRKAQDALGTDSFPRLYMLKPRRRCVAESYESCRLCTIPTPNSLSTFMVRF